MPTDQSPGTRDVDAGTNVEDEGLLRIRGLPTTKQFDADRAVGMTAGRAHHSMFPARLELAENEMPYTVWSRGRLVGHSELAYARVYPDMRMGDFELRPSAKRSCRLSSACRPR
jgi:hypothetical protein